MCRMIDTSAAFSLNIPRVEILMFRSYGLSEFLSLIGSF